MPPAALRVAFVTQVGDKAGGAEESLALLVRHLPPDIEPTLVSFESGAYVERLRGYGIATRVVAVPQTLASVTRENPAAGARAAPAVALRVAQLFARERFDLVVTNSMKAHVLAGPAARLARTPLVMHVRDMVAGNAKRLLGIVARMSREQIGISSALRRWYDFPAMTVILNPVDISAYRELPSRSSARAQLGVPDDGAPLIGIVGRINRWKGHDRFLHAVGRVSVSVPVRAVIVGEARFRDADFVPELERLVETLNLTGRVTFVPWLDDPRVAYAALDIHCNASEREPFGRSIVEAAAAGVPTVAFDDGGAVDIIDDGHDGRLVRAGDVAAFGDALLHYAVDATERMRAGRAAKEASERFAAPEHAARVAAVLRHAARRSPNAPAAESGVSPVTP